LAPSAATWAGRAWSLLAHKLPQLQAQQPDDARAGRTRDRRIQEHTDSRPGHGLDAMATALRFMERYTGLIDRDLVIAANPHGMLAYLKSQPTIRVVLDFLALDTDCQTGKMTGLPPFFASATIFGYRTRPGSSRWGRREMCAPKRLRSLRAG
jgi:hypothetical protein